MANLANLKGMGGDEAAAALNGIFIQSRNVTDATKGQTDAAIASQAAIAKLQTETERLSAVAQAAFFPMVSQVNLVADSMKKLNDALYGAIGAVNAETRSWIGIGLIIAGFGASILAAVKSVGTFMSLFGTGGSVIGRAISGIGSVLGRIGGIFLRFAGPVAALYAAFQLGTAIGETIYEMYTGVKTSINYFEIIADIFKDVGSSISDIFTRFENSISSGINSLVTGIKGIGNSILEFAPWLKTIGGYISSTVDVFKTIFTKVSSFIDSFVDVLATLVKGVASKFANKMSFGLIGSDTSDFVTDKKKRSADENQSAAETARFARPRVDSSTISVPKTPMASTIASPSAVEVQPPKVPDANAPGPTATAIASTAMAKPDSKADINSMLTFQSTLLEQILLSSNSLVSVNKEILRYTRNNA
jgi:phage-related protein